MKTNIITTIIATAMILTGCACNNNVEAKNGKSQVVSVMSEFSGTDNVEFVEIGGPLLGFGKLVANKASDTKLANGVKKLAVLEASDASLDVQEAIFTKIDKALTKYDLLLQAKDDGDNVEIYVDTVDDIINELVIFVKNEATVVAVSGRISLDEIGDIVNEVR